MRVPLLLTRRAVACLLLLIVPYPGVLDSTSGETDYLAAALWYAEQRGYKVFLVRADNPHCSGYCECKAPLIPKRDGGNGFLDATADPDQIRIWWTDYP
jgi:hypothetical protein